LGREVVKDFSSDFDSIMNAVVGDGVGKALLFLTIAENKVFVVVSSADFPNFARNIALIEPAGNG
jgi:hypothetical protein